ncbi:sensor histidine kinase [Tengunoibacter tsumagoiensis]|uniref:histidine kinase n=1 Tax=Tengunoibacter tsumagoiensis TaxID=2014871 RepID=A0A402A1Z6_9CHLR|nr:ATP-binding protein [Tengunoibacter tsumagoiensis]GCE13173.1 hypothetical protein KTT_30320 [Tengunoibacter tsumagoiensis]
MRNEHSLSTHNQEQARLLKALRESELLRELSELLASSLDTPTILQVLARRTAEVCEVGRCSVWLLDEKQHQLIPSAYYFAATNVKKKVLESASRVWPHSTLPFDDPLFQRLQLGNGLLFVEDLRLEAGMQQIARDFSVRSILLVALLRENRPLGILTLDNLSAMSPISREQQQLARAIGQQAAVAIDNARLYQQARDERSRAERLIERAQSIYQVATAVNAGEPLPSIMEMATGHLLHGLNVKSVAIVLLEKQTLTLATHTHSPPPQVAPALISNVPHLQATLKKGAPLFLNAQQLEGSWWQQLLLENVLLVPLLAGSQPSVVQPGKKIGQRSVGFVLLNYGQDVVAPSPGQQAFAQDIAAQCALAVEKAQMLTAMHHASALAHEQAQTLSAVFNAMTEGIIVFNMEGQIILSNELSTQFVHATRNDKKRLVAYLQNNQAFTLAGEPIAKENFALVRALRGEYIHAERFLTIQPDGSEQAVEINVVPLFDSEERQIGIVSAFRDITEQMRVEKRIRRALEALLNAAQVVSGITTIQEILFRILSMTMETFSIERGVVLLYDQTQQDFTLLLESGFQTTDIQHWLSQQRRWLVPEDSRYLSLHTQLMENHSTMVSEEIFDEESQRYQQTLILAAPIMQNQRLLGVMLLDRSSSHPAVNEQDEEMYHREMPLPQPIRSFHAWDTAIIEGIMQLAGLAIEQARWQHEVEIARTNEATMRESNALKDEFLAFTAHEFRTPLTVILTHSQMMARLINKSPAVPNELKERLKESTSSIQEQTRQLTNIVNAFLEVTQLNRGQINLLTEVLNLEDVIREAIETASATSALHTLSYTVAPSSVPYLLMGDRARLLQIFGNLLQNAIKYSPQGGPICIELSQPQDGDGRNVIEVSIADKGVGVPADALPFLFDRFYRAPNIKSSQARGIGLGLYLVAEFLRMHDGCIRVESAGIEGEGTCFTLTLPLHE